VQLDRADDLKDAMHYAKAPMSSTAGSRQDTKGPGTSSYAQEANRDQPPGREKKNQRNRGWSRPDECKTPNAIAAMPDILAVNCNVS
jgi:hypothetical protein